MKKETLKNLHSQVSVPGPSGPSCFVLTKKYGTKFCFIYDENLQVSGRMNACDFKTCSEEAVI